MNWTSYEKKREREWEKESKRKGNGNGRGKTQTVLPNKFSWLHSSKKEVIEN